MVLPRTARRLHNAAAGIFRMDLAVQEHDIGRCRRRAGGNRDNADNDKTAAIRTIDLPPIYFSFILSAAQSR